MLITKCYEKDRKEEVQMCRTCGSGTVVGNRKCTVWWENEKEEVHLVDLHVDVRVLKWILT